MRVTIEHREEKIGALGNRRAYYVDCIVQFSEEEKAIIKARGMSAHYVSLEPPRPPPTLADYISAGASQAFAPIVFALGLTLVISSPFAARQGYAGWGLAIMILAPVIWAWGYIEDRKLDYYYRYPKQLVTIRAMGGSKFSVHSPDPAYSEAVESHIREQLTFLKDRIMRSAEIKPRETFEL